MFVGRYILLWEGILTRDEKTEETVAQLKPKHLLAHTQVQS